MTEAEPIWLPREVVLSIHEELLSRFGGIAGVRDDVMLESALARPQQLWAYSKPSMFDMASAYATGIVKNHPFLDGNKRTGFMSAYTFLAANGLEIQATEEDVVLQTLALAAGALEEKAYAAWLERVTEF